MPTFDLGGGSEKKQKLIKSVKNFLIKMSCDSVDHALILNSN